MRNNQVEDRNVSYVAAEMRSIIHEAALPAIPGESVKGAILRASRRLNLPFPRTRKHWYGLVRLVPAEEADRLRVMRRILAEERLRRMDAEAERLRKRLAEWEER